MEIVAHQRRGRGPARERLLERLRAGVAAGADRLELDVRALGGRLVVAHDEREARDARALAVEDALALVAASGCDVLIDLKHATAATAVGRALDEAGLGSRAIVSGPLVPVQAAAAACGAQRAWTLPTSRRARPGAPAGPWGTATGAARGRVRRAAAESLAAARCDAVCVDRRFVTPELRDAVRSAGGRLLVWTVDRPADVERLAALPVDGLITNDPAGARRVLAAR